MKAEILYVNMPHPVENEIAGKIWKQTHYDENIQMVEMPIGFFRTYYRTLPIKEEIKNLNDLEKIYAKYNNYSSNPYSSDNDPGQPVIKKLGVRHTSMSIGDAVKVEGKYFIVCGIGFKRLELI